MWQREIELALAHPTQRGDSGATVKRVQEWLSLRGYAVQLDGEFGPATLSAVRRFQQAQQLEADGVVSGDVYARLVAPMVAALTVIAPADRSLAALTVAYAQQHLANRPREVGGQNRGPWVRLYMDGREGSTWRWCAGFACFALQQACKALARPMPIAASYSCDLLASSAQQRGLFVDGDDLTRRAAVGPGSLFLIRRSSRDWQHVGIVTEKRAESFDTIEGNTNDAGSDNGGEVAAHTRGYPSRDFIRIEDAPALA